MTTLRDSKDKTICPGCKGQRIFVMTIGTANSGEALVEIHSRNLLTIRETTGL
jgi:hypothetical protein